MTTDAFDSVVRQRIYTAAAAGAMPLVADLATQIDASPAEIASALRRLADGRALALQPDGEILMAEPFSAVPTAFHVSSGPLWWWASCIWDALGVAAMIKADAEVVTSCQCCGQRLSIAIAEGARIVRGAGVAHLVIPAADWWADIVFT